MASYFQWIGRTSPCEKISDRTIPNQQQNKLALMGEIPQGYPISRSIAKCSSTVILEDLKIKAMTRSAKGTMESFGTNVRQKSGLNREILRTGWGQLDQMLGYKCRKVIKVTAAYTSQRCYVCGHTEASNRKTQSKFKCMPCGHADHADLNAAANILASGIGAAARRGAFGLPTPMTREIDTSA